MSKNIREYNLMSCRRLRL